jgi:ABC-type amino acid transport substrate-binding protein
MKPRSICCTPTAASSWRTRFCRSLLLLTSLCWLGNASAGGLEEIRNAGVIRVCADPHNLPFSDMGLAPAGFNLDIAAEIARDLQVRLDYLWFHTAYSGRVLRQMYEHNCDFFMGLPTTMAASAPRLLLTRPYLRAGFVPVVREDSAIRSMADARDEKIGVEMMTVADFHLFRAGYRRDLYRNQEELFEALSKGQVRAAMMWLPVAAWSLKQHPEAGLKLLPVDDPALEFSLAIGVRKEDPDLRARIDQVLERLNASGELQRVLGRYGLGRSEVSR